MTVPQDAFWTRTSSVITIVRSFESLLLMKMPPEMIMRTTVHVALMFTVLTGAQAAAQLIGAADNGDGPLLQQEPDTPARLVRAASAAAQLQRTTLAQGYLQELIDRGLSDQALQLLRNDTGVQIFLTLNADINLQPQAGELLKLVNEATLAAKLSPTSAEDLIEQLEKNDEPGKQAALQLMTIGPPLVSAVMGSDPDSKSGRIARQILIRNVRPLRRELLAALRWSELPDKLWILELLKASADASLAPELLHYEFTAHFTEVRNAARETIDALWHGPGRPATSEEAVKWLSHQARRRLIDASDRFDGSLTGDELIQAVRFAKAAVLMDQRDEYANAVLLACQCAVFGDTADTSGQHMRSEALDLAIEAQNSAAALALMGSDPDALRRCMMLPSPTVRLKAAVRLAGLDRRVRGLPLAHRMIRDAAGGSTSPEAVVIDPRQDVATLASFLLRDLGYEVSRTLTGQGGFEQAVRQLNCELVLIHTNCLRWPLSQTVANLRTDSRTRQTPIAVYGPIRDMAAVNALQNRYPGISYLPGPLSEINFADELRRGRVPEPLLTESARTQLIQEAQAAAEL